MIDNMWLRAATLGVKSINTEKKQEEKDGKKKGRKKQKEKKEKVVLSKTGKEGKAESRLAKMWAAQAGKTAPIMAIENQTRGLKRKLFKPEETSKNLSKEVNMCVPMCLPG